MNGWRSKPEPRARRGGRAVTHEVRATGVPSVRRLRGGLLVAAMAAGCAAPGDGYTIHAVSAQSLSYYRSARGVHKDILSTTPAAVGDKADSMFRHINGSIQVAERCPLYYSRRGVLYLEQGQLHKAYVDLKRSVELCEDWVPGWLGLARWATIKAAAHPESVQDAEHFIEEAWGAVDTLDQRADEALAGATGTRFDSGSDRYGASRDAPALTRGWQTRLMLSWIEEEEAWVVERTPPSPPIAAKATVQARAGTLLRRLRAKIAHREAALAVVRGDPPDAILAMLDRVRDWDPDFAPALIDKAMVFRTLERFQEAESCLHSFFSRNADPSYRRNPRLRYEAGSLYHDWYLSEKRAEYFDLAEREFGYLLNDLDSEHADAWRKRGLLRIAAMRYAPLSAQERDEYLQEAKKCRDEALRIAGTTPAIGRLSKEIAWASSAAGGQGDQ